MSFNPPPCPEDATVNVEIPPLTCETDSVTVCPPPTGSLPFEVTVVDSISVEFLPLTCETDSITVCPPVSGVFDVNVVTPINVATSPLTCETDSVTVCPPVSGVFDVNIVNEFGPCGYGNYEDGYGCGRFLACETDSITVCPPVSGTFDVNVVNELDFRFLACETDAITVCPPVSGTFDVSDSNVPDLTGTWGYVAGVSGTEIIVGRVVSITAVSITGGSMVINGGDTITLPANIPISIAPGAQLVNPTIIFTNTASYFVEFLN